MKRYLRLIALFIIAFPLSANAQMEIDDLTDGDRPKIRFADSIRVQRIGSEYYSPARHRYERQMIRQERNTLEINTSLKTSATNYNDAWTATSGGDNSVTLIATVDLKHTYKKDKFTLSTIFSCKYGYYNVSLDKTDDMGDKYSESVWFKNSDELSLSITPSFKMSDNWSYGPNVKFRSQFTKGYLSSSSQESYNLKSNFLSPGYLDLSGSLIYNSPNKKYPFKITISPAAMSAVYVTSEEIRNNAQYQYKVQTDANKKDYVEVYGVSPYSSSKYEGGSSVEIYYDKYFGKDKFLRYTTTLFSFYGWMTQITHKNVYSSVDEFNAATEEWSANKDGVEPMLSIHPTVRWENKIDIKASKLLTTTLNFQLYYNRAQNRSVQTYTLLSVGLAYTFKNK